MCDQSSCYVGTEHALCGCNPIVSPVSSTVSHWPSGSVVLGTICTRDQYWTNSPLPHLAMDFMLCMNLPRFFCGTGSKMHCLCTCHLDCQLVFKFWAISAVGTCYNCFRLSGIMKYLHEDIYRTHGSIYVAYYANVMNLDSTLQDSIYSGVTRDWTWYVWDEHVLQSNG